MLSIHYFSVETKMASFFPFCFCPYPMSSPHWHDLPQRLIKRKHRERCANCLVSPQLSGICPFYSHIINHSNSFLATSKWRRWGKRTLWVSLTVLIGLTDDKLTVESSLFLWVLLNIFFDNLFFMKQKRDIFLVSFFFLIFLYGFISNLSQVFLSIQIIQDLIKVQILGHQV